MTTGSTGTARIPLFLPSAVWGAQQQCDPRLIDIKWRLRFAAAGDELEKMRKHLLGRSWIKGFKLSYGHGQRQGTRSAMTLESIDRKIAACAARYRAHHDVLQTWGAALRKPDDWRKEMCPLCKDDIRELTVSGMDAVDGEGDRPQLSWIWRVRPTGISDNDYMSDSLRIEFCKSRARALQWQEECILIQEEIRRTIETLRWEGLQWEQRATLTFEAESPWDAEGRWGYATRQSQIRLQHTMALQAKWTGLVEHLSEGEE
ncbi:hypothetical protein BDP27DRAFT_1433852 [Rhodocollybia butyracea]|uniref:Uncharacterized protein n=1 Tax=Rhodocollybia butyracea TaxID=206335 RepID=A0A9P5P5Z2_9AGAR|nr:hypothetical protein BDP27DRAFT_1433852 [Rhodocollybia butyracea]